jgi:hypothetical protein
MEIFDSIGSILNIAGQVLGGSGKDSAGAKAQKALGGDPNFAARSAAHTKIVTGFIDPDVDVKSGRGSLPANQNASNLLKMAFTRGGENLTDEQNTTIKEFISRLQQAQQRA